MNTQKYFSTNVSRAAAKSKVANRIGSDHGRTCRGHSSSSVSLPFSRLFDSAVDPNPAVKRTGSSPIAIQSSFKRSPSQNVSLRRFSALPSPTSPTADGNNSSDQSQTQLAPLSETAIAPIDFTTSSQVTGEESQILEVNLRPNQMLRAESGAMLYMTQGVVMETSMGLNSSGSGGMSAGLTRMMTGQNLMVSDFKYVPPTTPDREGDASGNSDGYGTVALGTDFPAKILRFHLDDYPDAKLICQKGAFLAGSHTVGMEMAFTKSFSAGFFGGEGFVLQALQGSGSGGDHGGIGGELGETVFLKAYGAVVKKTLKPNETLRISSGSLVAMTSTIDYDVTTLPGWKNVVFGGEGLFVTTLTGPGEVWLQGMPIDRMVSEIARKVPSGGGIGLGVPIFGGGGGEGGSEAAGEVGAAEGVDAGEGVAAATGGADAGVPLSDAAVEADRNATVALSGVSSDPESASGLFGDAAYEESSTDDGSSIGGSAAGPDSFSPPSDDFAQNEQNMPEFEEPTMAEEQFEDDGTTFSTFDESSAPDESSDEIDGIEAPAPSEEEGPSLFSQLWDFFTDDD